MAHLMPDQNDGSRNSSGEAVGGETGSTNGDVAETTTALEEELMLLSLFDDSSSNSGAIQDTSSSHSSRSMVISFERMF